MSYIGNTLTTQGFSPAIDYFSGTGSQTAFTLSRPVASVAQVQVVVNNVTQNPSTAYTVSGNTITFTGAPSIGTNNIYVSYTSPITQTQALTQSPSVIGPMYVGINGATPLGGATNPIMGMSGSANNYVQSYIQNLTNGANSSADFTAYPSNGTDAAGWVDMGITGPSFSQSLYSVTGPNEAYLFGSGPTATTGTGNLVIATDSTGTANAIQFYTNGFTQAKSAAAMTIDKNQNVGIGTSSPTQGRIQVTRTGASQADSNGFMCAKASDGDQNWISLGNVSTAGSSYSWIQASYASGYNNIVINPSGGNLLVGTTSTGFVNSNSLELGGPSGRILINHVNGTGSGTIYSAFGYNGGGIGSITQNGTNAVAYNTSSDYRLKENIQPMQAALATVAQLKPCTYTWKSDGSAGQGFIAHELQAVVPDCVTGQKDAVDAEGNPIYQGIDTSFLVATLTAAIQEQQAIITQLQADVAALKTKAGA
jgi:hypothetical protein